MVAERNRRTKQGSLKAILKRSVLCSLLTESTADCLHLPGIKSQQTLTHRFNWPRSQEEVTTAKSICTILTDGTLLLLLPFLFPHPMSHIRYVGKPVLRCVFITCPLLSVCLGDRLPALLSEFMLPWEGVERRESLGGGGLAGSPGTEVPTEPRLFFRFDRGTSEGGRSAGTGSFSRALYTRCMA